MARRPLLALFRGSDGRSIGRALAFLVLVNALLAGLHAGALAGNGTGPGVLCSLAQSSDGTGGTPIAPDHESPCCMAGCTTPAPVLPSVLADIAAPAVFAIGRAEGAAAWTLPTRWPFRVHGARGPPSLA